MSDAEIFRFPSGEKIQKQELPAGVIAVDMISGATRGGESEHLRYFFQPPGADAHRRIHSSPDDYDNRGVEQIEIALQLKPLVALFGRQLDLTQSEQEQALERLGETGTLVIEQHGKTYHAEVMRLDERTSFDGETGVLKGWSDAESGEVQPDRSIKMVPIARVPYIDFEVIAGVDSEAEHLNKLAGNLLTAGNYHDLLLQERGVNPNNWTYKVSKQA